MVLVVGANNIVQPREVKPGALIDGMRVVEGLKPGELVIVDGLLRAFPGAPVTPQQVAVDERGMPVAAQPATGAASTAAVEAPVPSPRLRRGAKVRTTHGHFALLHRAARASPRCCRCFIFIVGLLAIFQLPISEYPEVAPPQVVVTRQVSRREPARDLRDRGDAARGADQRPRRPAVLRQPGDRRRRHDADGHLQDRHQPRAGRDRGAEPRQPRTAAPAGHRAPDRRDDREAVSQPDPGGAHGQPGPEPRLALPAQLCPPAGA